MNEILEFLANYYLYVALGSLLIIVILILIIVLGNKRKKKKEKEEMVNIGEIKTGTIDDVANNINKMTQNEMDMEMLKPEEVSEVTQVIPSITPVSEIAPNPVAETAPSVEPVVEPEMVENKINAEPINPTPVVESAPVSIEPVKEEQVQNTVENVEVSIPVIDPVVPNIETIAPVVEAPTPETVIKENIEPAPVVNEIAPEPVEVPKETIKEEPLEMFGIEEPKPQGTAVQGFSSVNVEK